MQTKEKYLEVYANNNFVPQIIELTYNDFAAKKQGESFKFMLQQLSSVPTSANPLNDELILSLIEFIESQTFVNDAAKKTILLVVENCFASFFDMKAKGKLIWQNVLIVLGAAYKSDVRNIANIVNFKPNATPKLKVEKITPVVAPTVETDDNEPECDTCGQTITKSDLPIGKGEAKRAYKKRNK